MASIHILNSETIDKIAAGEVVERPSSVVKELVENAIDAGATAVTVEARDGGIELIRVTDNGCGMEESQLRTAFLRHATSKIENAEDLAQVSSLGFRGEALSSISAVAKVEVITKTAGNISGTRILLEGGKELGFDQVGAPEGTTFLMRNLFFNTPVRRKFLKQPATEGGYIADLMEHLALSRPDISFKLVLGGQMKFHTSGSGDLREVIYRIYGRDVAGALVPVSAQKDGIRVEGYLGRPALVRSNRNFEIYFINGRYIRSSVVSRAVEEGYKEYLMQHKFPLCVLHITMEPGCVDVNVHPTKMDVRFSDAIGFSRFLTETVRQFLVSKEMIPQTSLSTEKEIREDRRTQKKEQKAKSVPEPFEKNRASAYRVMEETNYTADHRQEFTRNPVWNRVKAGLEHTVSEASAAKGTDASFRQKKADSTPESLETDTGREKPAANPMSFDIFAADTEGVTVIDEKKDAAEIWEKAVGEPAEQGEAVRETEMWENSAGEPAEEEESFFVETTEFAEDIEQNTGTEISCLAQPEQSFTQLNLFEEKILTMDNRSRFRIIGQVFETYWLIEFEEKLLMIDQHAAHEKVHYERLMKRYHEKNVLSQGLLPPVIVSLSGQEESMLKEHMDTFAALGFEVEAFGGSEYALRGVPVDLYGCGEREMFLEVLDGLTGGMNFGSIRVIEEKIASMSCKAAVKGNNRLSVAEAEALIDELLTLDNPYNCPHGRPTIVTMTKAEMERKFKRIVN